MNRSHDIHAVLGAILSRDRFLVSSHVRPDGDAIGSILACGSILRQLGKLVDMVSSDPVPMIYRSLPCAGQIRTIQRVQGDYDAVILLECDGIPRSGLDGLEGRFLINIDHHVSGRNFADINWIETDACAVAEMVYHLAELAGVQITREMAACLYTSVLTDTGSFCYQGTDAHTFDIARELVHRGADPVAAATEVYFTNPASKMLLLGTALTNLKHEGPIAWMWITHEDMRRAGAVEEDCEGIVNYAIAVAGVQVAVFFRELEDGSARLSIRSKGPHGNRVSVAPLAERFGGGGHANASGCTVDGPLPKAIEMVLDLLREGFRETARWSVPENTAASLID